MRRLECIDLVGRLTEYREGSLGPDDLVGLAAHLQACDGCRAHAGQLDVLLGLMSKLPTEYISDDLESSLMVRYREWLPSVRV